MDKIDNILLYVQKTNPNMTKERLIHELSINNYSSKSLYKTYLNFKNKNIK